MKRYSGTLSEELGINTLAVKVLFYLFEQKVYRENPEHSKYDIYNGISAQAKALLPLYSKSSKITEKNVEKALADLVALGYIDVQSPRVKGKRAGRPAKQLYALKNSDEIRRLVAQRMKEKREQVMEIFAQLYEIEEAAAAGRGGTK